MFKLINLSRSLINSLNNSTKVYLKTSNLTSLSSINFKKMNEAERLMKEKSKYIVWVDCEMSGLDIDKDHLLEIACIITDKDLNIVAEGPEIIINQSDEVLNGMNEWCAKTHGESGLTQACRESKISVQKADEIITEFVQKHVPKGTCPLAGNSIHVDRIFLNKYMKNFLNHLHYRIIDVSTIKELTTRWTDGNLYYAKKNPHRALDDIKESIGELQFYRKTFFK